MHSTVPNPPHELLFLLAGLAFPALFLLAGAQASRETQPAPVEPGKVRAVPLVSGEQDSAGEERLGGELRATR